MKREELKIWAKEHAKKYRWEILAACIISSIISGCMGSISTKNTLINLIFYVFTVIITAFINVGCARFLTGIINDKKEELHVIFYKFDKNCKQTMEVFLLYYLNVFLYTLLLIIPGIIKTYSYSLVPYLLADDKYLNKEPKDILKLSEDLMNGHKMDLFLLGLSFIGWHLLAIFTLGLLEIWIIPYQSVATAKFILDIKNNYEAK